MLNVTRKCVFTMYIWLVKIIIFVWYITYMLRG